MKPLRRIMLLMGAVLAVLLPASPANAAANWVSVSGPGSGWWCTQEYKSANHAVYARNCVIISGRYAKAAMIVRNASGKTVTRGADGLYMELLNTATGRTLDYDWCYGVTIYSGTSKACIADSYTYAPCTYVGGKSNFGYSLPLPGGSISPPRSPSPRTAC